MRGIARLKQRIMTTDDVDKNLSMDGKEIGLQSRFMGSDVVRTYVDDG